MSNEVRYVAVVDRGGSAMRVVQAARELDREARARREPGVRSVIFFAAGDRRAPFVRAADEAVCIDDWAGIGRALLEAPPDVVWSGASDPVVRGALAEFCRGHAAALIGPAADLSVFREDRAALEDAARSSGVALAAAGASEFDTARRIEVPILADRSGAIWALGTCDTTLRFGERVVLAEAPALPPEAESGVLAVAMRLCEALGYVGAGVFEFRCGDDGERLELVRISSTSSLAAGAVEAVTGVDLVKLELHIGLGGKLRGAPPAPRGHAAAASIEIAAAEPGSAANQEIELLRLPTGAGVRVDAGWAEGDAPVASGPIAAVIAHGADRDEALVRLRRALADTGVIVRGATTNHRIVFDLLDRSELLHPRADARSLAKAVADRAEDRRHAEIALLSAAIDAYDGEHAIALRQFYAAAARGRPRVGSEPLIAVELRYCGHTYKVGIACLERGLYQVRLGGKTAEVRVERLDRFHSWLSRGRQRFRVLSLAEGAATLVEVEGARHRIARADVGLVRAPSPAVVLAIPAAAGDTVEAGARVMVLEAMKMEMPVFAPFAGRVRSILVNANVHVDTGTPLLVIDPPEEAGEAPATPIVELTADQEAAPEGLAVGLRADAVLAGLRRLVLGFDVDARSAGALIAEYGELRRILPAGDRETRVAEDEVIAVFADLASLFRRRPSADGEGHEVIRSEEYAFTFARAVDGRGEGLPAAYLDKLRRALAHYQVRSLDPAPELEEALLRIFRAHERADACAAAVFAILERRLAADSASPAGDAAWRDLLERLVSVSEGRHESIAELARELRYRDFDQAFFEAARQRVYEEVDENLAALAGAPQRPDRMERIDALVGCPLPLVAMLAPRFRAADLATRELMLEVLTRRYYRIRPLESLATHHRDGRAWALAGYSFEGRRIQTVATSALWPELEGTTSALRGAVAGVSADEDVVVDVYLWREGPAADADALAKEIEAALNRASFGRPIRRLVAVVAGGEGAAAATCYFTFRPQPGGGYAEERVYRGLHPMMGKRMNLWRLSNFEIERLPSVEDVYLFHGVAHENAKDERLFAIAEVRDLTPVRDAAGRIVTLPHLERMLMEALAGIRAFQAKRPQHERLAWNRVLLFVRPPLLLAPEELDGVIRHLAPATEGLGIEQVAVLCRMPSSAGGELQDTMLRVSNPSGSGLRVTYGPPPQRPLQPLSAYDQKVLRMRQRGLVYPYETVAMLAPARGQSRDEIPPGEFVEYDLDADGRLVPVSRPPGLNTVNIVAGVIRSVTPKFPEGMARVILLGDPSRAMGALAEPECRRINAAIDLAEQMSVPLEWFALSAGAKISMESGTENMDWIAAVLRRIIEFTQNGGEINVVVNGINVGAQPYWNAEATMLLHTRGILVMTPLGAMVLTGKQALDYSGSVSAEDNFGIGGYERVMGPNGQAQYWARDIGEAAQILMRHYELTYVVPGERFPRPGGTSDPRERDIRPYPHGVCGASDFERVGDIFSGEHNRERKRPFSIRRVMHAVVDQDHAPLERWSDMVDAEIGVVWDAHLGGQPVCLIGIESQPLRRAGFLPADGPDHWTAGTLFPRSSKKIARALNAASGNRPVVVLANLSGFDGSPESMRNLQLEYGAEIGRAVVNFDGPIVFCVVSRYHGGAYVVFSKQLNRNVEAAAIEGSYASVIGGAPAAAVVFAGEVQSRSRGDARVRELEGQVAAAESDARRAILRARLENLKKAVYAEKLGEVADEFDGVHSVQRALAVGSLDHILPPERLRPYLIEAVERGMRRAASG